jgi:hypothetical protein
MEIAMPVFTRSGWAERLGIGVLALIGVGIMSLQPAPAQTRTLAGLADVPAYAPAPYHPHMLTAHYGGSLYDSSPYYGGVYLGGGAHYWH